MHSKCLMNVSFLHSLVPPSLEATSAQHPDLCPRPPINHASPTPPATHARRQVCAPRLGAKASALAARLQSLCHRRHGLPHMSRPWGGKEGDPRGSMAFLLREIYSIPGGISYTPLRNALREDFREILLPAT